MGTTPKLGLPYPEPTASVDVPRDVRALALAIDALSSRMAGGLVNLVIAAGTWKSGGLTVTYPSGRFTVAPVVLANCQDNEYYAASISMSATACQVSAAWNPAVALGANVTPTVQWYAIQIPAIASTTAVVATDVEPEGAAVVTCHTVGCFNGETPITVPIMKLDEVAVACGVCGEPVADVVLS